MTNKTYTPGQIVTMAGIEFVVLDDLGEAPDGGRYLFLLTLKSQGQSTFGDDNNYVESSLMGAVRVWWHDLCDRLYEKSTSIEPLGFKPRTIDLTTLDGYKGFGSMEVAAAPLTLDEARKYAEVIPDPDETCWLATGWGGPEHFGSADALLVYSNGDWFSNYCSGSYGVRPALIAPSSILGDEGDDTAKLSGYTTDELLEEVRRRMEGK